MYMRPVLVTVPKATIQEGIASGAWGSVHSIDVNHMLEGSTRDYVVDQITVVSEDEPTTGWGVAFFGASTGTNADLDVDTTLVTAMVTPDTASGLQSGIGYYHLSDLTAYIKATDGAKTQPWDQAEQQIHIAVSPQGGAVAKTAGATGEMTVQLWLIPLTR